jgi:hypothetical protein
VIPRKVMNIKIKVETRRKFENRADDRNNLGKIMKKQILAWQEFEYEVFGKPQIERRDP